MDDIAPPPEPKTLRFLRRLVTVLTATMIVGVLTIVVLLVIRLQQPGGPALPDQLDLPQGAEIHAITQGPDFWAVVTKDNQIHIFHPDGSLRQTLALD